MQEFMIGRIISHYRVLDVLGQGGMGIVYKAEDTRLKRIVALKVLAPELARDRDAKRRLLREAEAASMLDHAHVCTIYEVGETSDGQPFIAMAYYEGETLREMISRGPLKVEDAVDLTIQIADGLNEAHERKIVHRDVKSSNILITPKGQAKVLDFGLARVAAATKLTKSGATIGTAAYMSPEQARGENVDHRSDIWSLGVLLYEMVTGRLPFGGEFEQAIVYRILNEEPEPLSSKRSDVPIELDRIVAKALRKDRSERYQSVHELSVDLSILRKDLAKDDYGSRRAKARPFWKTRAFFYGGTAALLILLATAAYFWWTAVEKYVPSSPPAHRIAVLPFQNISSESQNEYFADGMTEELIATLSKIVGLRVIARTSVMRFKGTRMNIADIGKELNVGNVLEGSVRKEANKIRITAQLIDVQTQEHLWSQEYDRELQDVFDIQSSIAAQVTEALKLQLLSGEMERIEKAATKNVEAYTLYLKGRYFWNEFSRDGLLAGIEYFKQALEKDKDYALAYSGMADCYSVLGVNYLPPEQTMPKAKAAAKIALQIDDMLAEAHTSLAAVTIFYDWDGSAAEKILRDAIEINPSYAPAHELLAYALELTGRPREAMAEIRRAKELDPLSLVINLDVGIRYYYERQYDQAIRQYRNTLEIDPNLVVTHRWLALAYEQALKPAQAIAEFERVMVLTGQPERAASLRRAYANSGYPGVLHEQLKDTVETLLRPFFTPYDIAATYARLGEKTKGIEWLERACEERFPHMPWVTLDPRVDPLRSDPRFVALLKRVGLQR
jgi:serine/threonine protein kinase/Tfp pilus assembly protein PilF